MKNIDRLLNKRFRKIIFYVLASIVVFCTTYALVLPAITIDEETADEDPAICNETVESEITNELETVFDPFVIEQEREELFNSPEFIEKDDTIVFSEEEEIESEEKTEMFITSDDIIRFYDDSTSVIVTVEAPLEAFPEGTYMVVLPVDAQDVLEIVNNTLDENKAKRTEAVDISFYNQDDQEVEPSCEIKVSLVSDLIRQSKDTQVIHIDSSGEGTLIEQSDEASEENEVIFESKDFSTYVVVVSTDVLTADGETYKITVTYDENAMLPDNISLSVQELIEGEAYESYKESIESGLGIRLSYARLFDISILSEEGEKIQPKSPVNVTIELNDLYEDDDPMTIHIPDSGEVQLIDETDFADHEISFDAEGFSVYGIVSGVSPSELDGKTYGIVFNVNTTGIALKSQAVNNSTTQLMGQSTVVRVEPIKRTENVFVANNSNISMWTFNQIEENTYYITTVVNDAVKHLRIADGALSLADTIDENCRISVTEGSGNNANKFRFSSGEYALARDGNNFKSKKSTGNETYMYLAELSNLSEDDFVVYTATKVSVSGEITDTESETSVRLSEDTYIEYDVKDGEQVILYTRIWNESKYDYYAIDYDGMLVKAYESGDTISWVGSKVNTMLWDFTEYHYDDGTPNYYYELQNAYSGKYIAPQVEGRTYLSDKKIGINLNGRRNIQYYTTIQAWDSKHFDYAALKDENWKLTTVPMSKAGTFYFAVMEKNEGSEAKLTEVATIDHKPFGITLKMQDYPYQGYYIDGKYRSEMQSNVLGLDSNKLGILKKNLESDGYPMVVDKDSNGISHSLNELYNNTMEVNQQFLLSTYNETGYFEYDSTKNFAHLITSENDYWFDKDIGTGGKYKVGDFVIYDQLGTSGYGTRETLHHGQFLPYNDIQKNGIPISYSKNKTNQTDLYGNPLSSLDPRKGEKLFEIPYNKDKGVEEGYVDYFFGMEMSANFMQSESGLDEWGHDLIFEFSGDDDFWLYIDDMLVLDLGGVHSALDGNINFKTGVVKYRGIETNLRDCYKNAYLELNSEASEAEINTFLDKYFKDGGTVFKDYSGHSMKMFYMERGASASNLHMRFNLAPYTDGEILLEKQVTGAETVDMEFPYQIFYRNVETLSKWVENNDQIELDYLRENIGKPIEISNVGIFLFDEINADSSLSAEQIKDSIKAWKLFDDAEHVTDNKTDSPIKFKSVHYIDGLTYNDVFFLKHDQTASILFTAESNNIDIEETEYFIKECGIDEGAFRVKTNGVDAIETRTVPEHLVLKDYCTSVSSIEERKKVIYENHVSSNSLKSLTVTKRLWQDVEMKHEIHSGDGDDTDNQIFRFRIYIGKNGENYTIYNTGKYYVKNPEGEYCIYQDGEFVSTHKTDFSELSTEVEAGAWKSEQEMATFHTSPGGAADEIIAGYSIEIPDLMIGTTFMIEERSGEIPLGYKLLGYTLTEGEYSTGDEQTEGNTGIATNSGTISSDKDETTVSVHNQHGYGLNLIKEWSDADFMDSHDDIYFGVYIRKEDGTLDLLTDSLRRLSTTETSIRWFFSKLEDGKTLNDYLVYELQLEEGKYTVNSDGTINLNEDCEVNRIEENGLIRVGGSSNEHGYSPDHEYTVNYVREVLTNTQIEDGINSRTDVVSNSRAGIKIIKTNMKGEALEGAVFELEKKDDNSANPLKKTFISLEDGLIAMAYLTPNDEYILTEKLPPYRYKSLLTDPLTIKIDDEGILYVNDTTVDNDAYTITQVENPTASVMPTITIKNQPITLKAIKVDKDNNNKTISGVKFELYREVIDFEGNPMPDYVPMHGFENLETGEDGIIPKIDLENLNPGNYYLHETVSPNNYQIIPYYIRLSISNTGEFDVLKAVRNEGLWQFDTIDDGTAEKTVNEDGVVVYIRDIPSKVVQIKKVTENNKTLAGAEFELYKISQIENGYPKQGETPIIKKLSGEDGIVNLGALDLKVTYYLYETKAPDGYNLLSAPVIIFTKEDGNLSASIDGSSITGIEVISGENGNPDIISIPVYNSSGVLLPASGGMGTDSFRLAGSILMISAVLILISERKSRK